MTNEQISKLAETTTNRVLEYFSHYKDGEDPRIIATKMIEQSLNKVKSNLYTDEDMREFATWMSSDEFSSDKLQKELEIFTVGAKERDAERINFIQWVMAETEWRHYDDDATTWTNGRETITTQELLEKYRNK